MKFWATILAIVTVIVVLGWREPLRYRFMTSQEVYDLEHPATPPPAEPAKPWMWDPSRSTKLDRSPYHERGYFSDGMGRNYPVR